MPKSIHTVDPIDVSSVSVRRQPYKFLSPAYKLSYTNIVGERECVIVIARTSFAVESMARRILGIQGCSDFVIGRYRGSLDVKPAPPRNARNGRTTGDTQGVALRMPRIPKG